MFGVCACGGGPDRAEAPVELPGPLRVVADWDDVGPAVAAAADRHELAVLHRERPDERTAVFRLIGVRSEAGSVTLRRLGDALEMTEIEIEAEVGLPADPRRQRRFQRDIGRRLEQLAGVEVSPIRW